MRCGGDKVSLINKCRKLIFRSIDYCWAKMNPVIFVHSSDLMLPGEMGITASQVIVISRLFDIEIRKKGGITGVPEYLSCILRRNIL